jgi:hypothetical protein
MDYIWIALVALSAIILAVYGKKVEKAQHPNAVKATKKGKKKQNRMFRNNPNIIESLKEQLEKIEKAITEMFK